MSEQQPPSLEFVGYIGFIPEEKYQVEGEYWEYETKTSKIDSEGNFTVSIKLNEPKRLISSRRNAHP